MKDISQNILEKIKDEHIIPIPRWKFLLKNYGRWVAFALFVLMGSISISVVIFMLTDHDWDIYRNLNKSFVEYLLLSLPYFWFLLLSAFIAFAWYDLEKTKTGYKYGFFKIGLINISLSVILGIIFFYAGLGIKIDKIFADNLPYYQNIHQFARPGIWQNPDRGLLVGKITDISENGSFHIIDPGNQNWLIECFECVIRGNLIKENGMIVKLIGKQIGDQVFQVSEIRPWMPPKGNRDMKYFSPNRPMPLPLSPR